MMLEEIKERIFIEIENSNFVYKIIKFFDELKRRVNK